MPMHGAGAAARDGASKCCSLIISMRRRWPCNPQRPTEPKQPAMSPCYAAERRPLESERRHWMMTLLFARKLWNGQSAAETWYRVVFARTAGPAVLLQRRAQTVARYHAGPLCWTRWHCRMQAADCCSLSLTMVVDWQADDRLTTCCHHYRPGRCAVLCCAGRASKELRAHRCHALSGKGCMKCSYRIADDHECSRAFWQESQSA